MKTIILAVLGVAVPGMALAQSPTFALNGFPVSLHQAQVTAPLDLQEQVAAPIALGRGGFATSPVQVLVLTPHGKQRQDTAAREEIGHPVLTLGSDR